MSDTLPPLPEPFAHFQRNTGWRIWAEVIPSAAGEAGVVAAFTADQIREYAMQAVLADRAAREPVWCGCGDGIMPDTGAKCWVCASLP